MLNEEELANRFKNHPPKDNSIAQMHNEIRTECYDLAVFINENVPDGREKSLAITHLEEVMMWSNKGIAGNV